MQPDELLRALGKKLRALRVAGGLSQKRLAQLASLSPRYVSQLESGQGNISILRLYELTQALGVTLDEFVRLDDRPRPIALIGLRGAGKSTVGQKLADKLARPFVELDALIEDEAGLSLSEIFALHGEAYYRRLEREVLVRTLATGSEAILATGGGLVNDDSTYQLLKSNTITIWLRAKPKQHLERVIAQGDRRPMAGRADPLAELRALLKEREPLYREAEIVVDTSTLAPELVTEEILRRIA